MDANLYIAIYYNLLLLVVLISFLYPINSNTISKPYYNNKLIAFILLLIVFVHIIFRPLSPLFGDTITYSFNFKHIALWGVEAGMGKDWGFQYLTYFISQFFNLTIYWAILCALYVLPVYISLKNNIPKQYAVAFLLFICSFSFWGYGVNGLRNGIATSLVIYALMVPRKLIVQILILCLAYSFHSSVLLPIGMFFISKYIRNSKYYLIGWFFCLILSITAHGFFENILSNLSIFEEDDRLSSYMTATVEDTMASFSRTGLRWDFILYSLVPILLGYRYLYKYCYKDELYQQLFNIYTSCNAFWLLIMYVPYNNRFAYLSWFLYPIVIGYPLLKVNLLKRQDKLVQLMILLNYMFTYLMWLK
ncbi:Uncharacterised protein [Parabacteroides merdae]|uniref:EpsG family protein n=1 Tax=Parabacteroides merdae TaxID=46503 RepID=UPI0006C32FFF|nr:EpsG family protein [Parabacteroides merdae]CUO56539.1 Uncharacterised protein [Parabacteroides merdae]